ncbi:SusC/RagA family TonB-linked outer membrane protein [Labilibacter marinus]|uniref:SusC/RagA family TonB-linked outer membrane protein n=1 Tax=Labilibacter marinus TaxID=1477105 RepID=UPI0009500D9B|nr:TonB-dependent receptor [Labilibacter marinus]
MKKSLLSLMLCFLSFAFMHAQSIQVSGKVTDGSNGDPLPGVSVAVVGTSTGTITDIDGKYSLSVPSEATLAVSFIGYAMQQVAIAGQSNIDIVLQPDLISLDEVVAVGYGVVKKRDVTGSVGSVSADKLLAQPITSLDAGLQGKIAGVSVQQTTGAPGQKMKIRIRGGASINYSNEPLYVIDGFIGADITTINPSDIATIDVLKDASATAVYGSRGANGVVLITTNTPKAGKFKFSFDANAGVSTMINEYNRLSAVDQMLLMNEQDIAGDKDPAFDEGFINLYRTGERKATDWTDLLTQQGVTQNYSFNATGGSEKIQYYFSANYNDEKGVIKNSFYKRAAVRSNIKAALSDKIDLVFNTYGTSTKSQANGRGTGGRNNVIGMGTIHPQLWEPYITADNIDRYQAVDEFGKNKYQIGDIIDPNDDDNFNGTYQAGGDDSPLHRIRQNQESFSDRVISNLDLTFDLGANLTLFISNSGSYNSTYSGSRALETWIKVPSENITAQQRYGRNVRWMNTDILTYENDFGRHHLKVSGVYEYSKTVNRNMTGSVGELSTLANEWYLLGNGKKPLSTVSNYYQLAMRSWMGRANYSFADKYLFTASVRADGTSVFSEDTRWGYFPSAAFAWRASEEPFIRDIDFIHNLKLRAGFGATGNTAIGPYVVTPSIDGTPSQNQTYYPMYGELTSGTRPASPANNAIQWETTKQYNFGLDIAVLNGKLSAVLDLYSKQSTDVIIGKSIPRHSGFNSYTDNVAEIHNKGFELGITWNIINNSDFNWDANFNIARNVNEVVDLGGDSDQIFIANEEAIGMWGQGTKFVVQKGESMGSFYGLKKIGLWQPGETTYHKAKPGETKYEDVNEDGKYTASDRQIIGNASPDFTYALNTSLMYKGVDLNIQCVGSQGNEIYNYSESVMQEQARIVSSKYLDRWTPDNPNSDQQTMPVGNDQSMKHLVSQHVEDGSFFKISNITLGYTLPKKLTDKAKLGNVRFYASMDNVLTITGYTGLDPEASSTNLQSDSQAGIDAFSYPLTRTVRGGVKINF